MTTNEDSNKLIIYKGKLEEYAFIPLTFKEAPSYDFANSIICNDGSTYIKNITADSSLYNFIKDKIMDAAAPAIRDKNNPTISITSGTYNINGYLNNDMLTHIITLYYIENFKYTLDTSQYVTGDDENISTVQRGDTYMFTITPELTQKDIDNIEVREASESGGGESGGGSGSGGGDTSSGETEDTNKKYDIKFSVDGNQTLTLTRIGATNNYKLGGTLVINYEQSDNSIKGDVGTISTITNNNSNYAFPIYLGTALRPCVIQKIDGYNTTSNLWEGEININLDEMTQPITYTSLRPGSTISCELHMNISKDVPIFSKHGSRLNSYVADTKYGKDNFGLYKFKLNNISVPNTSIAYFLQSTLRCYETWKETVNMVMSTSNLLNNKVSGIFIIITDGVILNKTNTISSKIQSTTPSFASTKFKVPSTTHNSIFTSPVSNNTVELDGPPIFLYDENKKQTEITSCKTGNDIFNERYFKHNSGNKFSVSTDGNKNIINLDNDNYKAYMYEFTNNLDKHYCGTRLSNADLSAYEGRIFNVVCEVWSYTINFVPSINTPIKNKNDEYILTAVSPSYNLNQKIDRIDWETGGSGGGGTTKPASKTYTETVIQYNLYSFKLSKNDPTTGVYTFND